MKNRADAETRLLNELNQWIIKQIENPHKDYYLYYLKSTPSHDGELLICSEPPPNSEFRLAMAERINKTATVKQNFNWIRFYVLGGLPILSSHYDYEDSISGFITLA